MPLFLNDEQTMLRDTAKDFVAEHAPVSHMRALRDADDQTGFSRDLWKQFAEMGFTGMLIGEDQRFFLPASAITGSTCTRWPACCSRCSPATSPWWVTPRSALPWRM